MCFITVLAVSLLVLLSHLWQLNRNGAELGSFEYDTKKCNFHLSRIEFVFKVLLIKRKYGCTLARHVTRFCLANYFDI